MHVTLCCVVWNILSTRSLHVYHLRDSNNLNGVCDEFIFSVFSQFSLTVFLALACCLIDASPSPLNSFIPCISFISTLPTRSTISQHGWRQEPNIRGRDARLTPQLHTTIPGIRLSRGSVLWNVSCPETPASPGRPPDEVGRCSRRRYNPRASGHPSFCSAVLWGVAIG